MKRFVYILLMSVIAMSAFAQSRSGSRNSSSGSKSDLPKDFVPSTAWVATEPLGLREPVPFDTLEQDYYQRFIPSTITPAYVCTGNFGTQGKDMLWMGQKPVSQFFLEDAMRVWVPYIGNHVFYNTSWPRTQVSYNTGGGKEDSQDRLQAIFTGNFSKIAQFGANVDYLYSKGSYSNQSSKHMNWGLSGSYLGDRYEFQGSWYHYNMLNKENGGITDDLYITDPAEIQGGVSTINPQTIPTVLRHATNRYIGGELFLNNRYKVGYWHEEHDSIDTDSVVSRTYIPVSSFIWNLNYKESRKRFIDSDQTENKDFWENTYLSPGTTCDVTRYWSLKNTVGISLLEGFHKYAKFGLAAYATYEIRKFIQTPDTLDRSNPTEIGLTPFPEGITSVPHSVNQNLAWVGAEISKQHGSILTYEASGELGLVGDAIGEVKVRGKISTRIPLFGDTVQISGYGHLLNTTTPYLIQNYLSNHFIWHNNFSKERRLRFGGIINIPWTNTSLNVGTETLQNYIYFNDLAMPAQNSAAIQVLSATLQQNFAVGILHWDNKITYQTSTDEHVLPLPKLAVYSNLYIKCNIATLSLQLGLDCDYYTRYYAPSYQPATATFYNQHEIKCGNYPFMTAYANMKLGRTRFYVMMTHINQGIIGGNDYFAIPHYPLNPRRFQLGLSVDFWN